MTLLKLIGKFLITFFFNRFLFTFSFHFRINSAFKFFFLRFSKIGFKKRTPVFSRLYFLGRQKKKIVDLFQFKRIKQKCRFLYRFLSKAHLGFKKKYQQTLIKIINKKYYQQQKIIISAFNYDFCIRMKKIFTHAIVSIRYRRMVIS